MNGFSSVSSSSNNDPNNCSSAVSSPSEYSSSNVFIQLVISYDNDETILRIGSIVTSDNKLLFATCPKSFKCSPNTPTSILETISTLVIFVSLSDLLRSDLLHIKKILLLRCGTPKNCASRSVKSTLYPNSFNPFISCSNAPVLSDNTPGTFSHSTHLGFTIDTTRKNSSVKLPLGSSNPLRSPATLNA